MRRERKGLLKALEEAKAELHEVGERGARDEADLAVVDRKRAVLEGKRDKAVLKRDRIVESIDVMSKDIELAETGGL